MGHNVFQHLHTSSLKGGNLGWILWPGSGPHGLYGGTDFGGLFFFGGYSDGDGGSFCSGGGLSEVGGLRGGAAGAGVVG